MIGRWAKLRRSTSPADDGLPRPPWGGWQRLRRFWAAIVALIAFTIVAVQIVGPPDSQVTAPQTGAAPLAQVSPVTTAAPAAQSTVAEEPTAPAPKDADASLYERAPRAIGGYLPRVAPDGRRPMEVFSAPFDRGVQGPRVGLIVAGIGMNDGDTSHAIGVLPVTVALALSPYAGTPDRVIAGVRKSGHEFLMAVPMEPVEFPLSDPGPRALMTHLSPEENLERLHWVMSRGGGYVGMTNALGGMRGERFAGMGDQMSAILREVGRRGLLFVDVRADAGRNQWTWHRSVDLVIDEIPTEERIEQRLELLSRLARDRGSALGLATQPRSVTIARIAAWANGLADRGITLAPVTSIALPPAMPGESR